jgi:hypothetical protein
MIGLTEPFSPHLGRLRFLQLADCRDLGLAMGFMRANKDLFRLTFPSCSINTCNMRKGVLAQSV